jgi:acetyl esterase/lipase
MVRLALALPLLLLSGCTPLRAFDALVPKDAGTVLAAREQAFKPGKRGRLDVYAPKGTKAGAGLPVIVFFYGGS